MKINIKLLNRILAQPWAIQREQLALLTQLVIAPEDAEAKARIALFTETSGRPQPRAGAANMRTITTPWGTRRNINCAPNVVPLNWESACACDDELIPTIPPDVTCILVWGPLGRAWSAEDRYWFDPVDYDALSAAVASAPPGNTIVLWIRSPGGVCPGCPETAAALRTMAKTRRCLVWTDDLCASAAYWLSSQCERIDATPTASVGCIGVYIAFYDWTEYLAKLGISLELFKAGSMKAMGLPGNPLSDEESAFLQAGVDETYRLFVGDVRKMRDVPDEACQGQCLDGKAALDAVLVDGFQASTAAYFTALGKGKI